MSSVLRIWNAHVLYKQQQQLLNIQLLKLKTKAFQNARNNTNPNLQWTRRIIALTATFSIVLLPKLLPFISPETPLAYLYPEVTKKWFLFSSPETLKAISFPGLVITPLDTHILAAIIGLYFGGALIKVH